MYVFVSFILALTMYTYENHIEIFSEGKLSHNRVVVCFPYMYVCYVPI